MGVIQSRPSPPRLCLLTHTKKMRELSLFLDSVKSELCWTVETSRDCTLIIPSLRIIESNFHDGAEMKLTSVACRKLRQRRYGQMMSDTQCAFHSICSALQFTDGASFIPLAPNSSNWLSKCTGPSIGPGSYWEGIWPALLPGRECVRRAHQSLPSPGELNKLIGRQVGARSSHCGPHSSIHPSIVK